MFFFCLLFFILQHYENHPYPPPVETDTGHKLNSGKMECSSDEQKMHAHMGESHHDSKVERNPGEKPVLEDDDSDIESNDSRYDEMVKEVTVKYAPGESICGMFGGNSNWRGPIWLCSK